MLTGLSFSLPNPLKLQSPVLLRLAGVKVAAVSVNKDSMLDLLQGYFPQFSKLNIDLSGNGILFGASYNNTPFAGRLSILSNEKTGDLMVRCQTLDIAGFTLPDMITRQIAYVLSAAPSAGRPFKVEVGQVLFGKNAVTVSEYDKNTAAPVAMPTVVDRLR